MKIKDLDECLRNDFHILDIVSYKVEGGYMLKVYEGKYNGVDKWLHMSDEICNADDEIRLKAGHFYVEKCE